MTGDVALAFLAGMGIVALVTTNAGWIADKRWCAVALQPLIAAMWVLGTTSVVKGAAPSVAYIIGSTCGSALAMKLRKRA